MVLVKPLRDILSNLDLQDQKAAMGMKAGDLVLHQVIAGEDAADQARKYARELVARKRLKAPPVELNCRQPMNEFMVQQAFKDAKKGMLIVTEIGHLARREAFVAEAEKALAKGHCILVICGDKRAVDIFLADEPDLKKQLPSRVDMGDAAIQADLAAETARLRKEEVENLTAEHTVLQKPMQVTKPLAFGPKTKN